MSEKKQMGATPCYQCKARTDRCHSVCELYASWRIRAAEYKKLQEKERELDQALREVKENKHRRLSK